MEGKMASQQQESKQDYSEKPTYKKLVDEKWDMHGIFGANLIIFSKGDQVILLNKDTDEIDRQFTKGQSGTVTEGDIPLWK